ncbi:cation:proton antiporter domain-containing protein [Sphingomonas sp. AX6]|uniref:cation:proton antiporter domain-containing protein n=1 Tax=Sphingomonas sp. AX6 TaxID=2653171 RepID=UPI00135BCCE0|nr:cation:proton antiporter [Sphingomonas sp. AX6]
MALDITNTALSDTLVILGAAGLVIPAFARFKISPVIGFILVGALVGPAGLGAMIDQFPWLYYVTITQPESIAPFAEFGIVLLLFTVGLELSFKRLWSMRNLVFGVGAVQLVSGAVLLGLGLWAIGQPVAGAIGLGLALTLSSTGLVLPMTGTTSAIGRPTFAMLLAEDLALVPIIILLAALAPSASDEGWEGLGEILLRGGIVIAVLLVAGRFVLPRLFAQAARTKSPELFLAASLLVVIVASLATAAAGLSPIVGALIAGIVIAETEYGGEVEATIEPFKGLALGIFLLSVGMMLDLRMIVEYWPSLLAAVVGVIAVKTLVVFLLLRATGVRRGMAAEIGVLMSSPSELTIVVLGTAAAAQLILPPTAAFWTTVTAIGLTITPLLAKAGRIIARKIEGKAMDDDMASDTTPDGDGPGTVIIGFGRVGRLVADMLRAHDKRFVAVDADPDTVAAARAQGYPIRFGDVARPDVIDHLRLGHADALILTMDDPVLSIRVTRRVRNWVPALPIVARARDSRHAADLYRAGATDAVPETLESSLQLSEAVLVDLGVAMGPVIASIHEKRDEMRQQIKADAQMEREPRLRRLRKAEVEG